VITKAAFVICTERAFENKSVLLVRSIRQFAGFLSTAPIYSFCPRENRTISPWAASELSRLGVEHRGTVLNQRYTEYGVYNKPFVCAYSEGHIDAELLVFLDSDQVIFNEPSALMIDSTRIAAARPVGLTNIGVSRLQGGIDEEYWRQLYTVCGVQSTSTVKTTITDCEILAYFNSGMISTRPEDRVWSSWARNFERVMQKGLQPHDPFYIEQSVFSATLTSMNKPVALLPPSYNYPIPAHGVLLDSKRIKQCEQLVSIHYHRMFDDGNWRPFLDHLPYFDKSSFCYRWLLDSLSELA
jgi:hypothetical protein